MTGPAPRAADRLPRCSRCCHSARPAVPAAAAARQPRSVEFFDVLDQLFDLRLARVDLRRLVGPGQKRRSPVLRALRGQAIGAEHDESRQVLVFRARVRMSPTSRTRVEPVAHRRSSSSSARVHDSGYRCTSSESRTRSSTHSPTCGKMSLTSMPLWPYFLKLNGDGKAAPVRRSVLRRDRHGFTGEPGQRGLRIEGVDVRRAAVHEQMQNALRLGGERRLLRSERIDRRI